MLTSNPAALRRTFGGGGGGGAEHGLATSGVGGAGGGGHGGWGSPTDAPAAGAPAPPAGPTGNVYPSSPDALTGEPGYRGRGGGGGGGGYSPPESVGGGGGAGVIIIQAPTTATITVGSISSPFVNTYTSGGKKFHVIHADNGTISASGSVQSGTVTFS